MMFWCLLENNVHWFINVILLNEKDSCFSGPGVQLLIILPSKPIRYRCST